MAHPGTSPWAAVYGRALVTPIATCMLPVMILTLVGVLEGVRVVPHVFWAAGGALALAAVWTSFRLRSRIVEIDVDDQWVRVASAWDVVHRHREPGGQVLEIRDYSSWAILTVGLSTYEIHRDEWTEYEELLSALKLARESSYMQ